MAKDPAFLFYSKDFYVGTSTLSFEDKGKYITILCLMHQKGHMSESAINFIVGEMSEDLRCKFCIDENGLFFSERLDIEIEKRGNFTESRRINGQKGGRPSKDDKPLGLATDNHSVNANVNTILDNGVQSSFDAFWDLYDKKVGSKEKLIKKWSKLSQTDRDAIMAHIPKYKAAQPDKQYRKNPETYLNNKSWLDELISKPSEPSKEQVGISASYIDKILKQQRERTTN